MSVSEKSRTRRYIKPSMHSSRTAGRVFWILSGFIVGIIATILALALLAPAPTVLPASAAGSSDVTITIDDAYLSAQVADGVSGAKLPVTLSNIQCHIAAGDVVTMSSSAGVLAGLVSRELTAQSHIYVMNGRLAIHIDSASIGGLSIPSGFYGELQNSINSQLSNAIPSLSTSTTRYKITNVTSTAGYLTMTVGKG